MNNKLLRYIIYFFGMILFFCLGMILVYQIPNKMIRHQYNKSAEQISKEDVYANFLFNSDASILDNFTDKLMLDNSMISENYTDSLHAAFDNNGYPRYWNGYLLTLRPMLTQFSYQQIRYINMLILILLFCFCFSGIRSQFGNVMALGFALSVTMCFLVFIGESLQYFSVFLILFIEILCLLRFTYFRDHPSLLLFAGGMVTVFFDLLTAPLLTLGIPLILIISFDDRRYKDYPFVSILRNILCLSFSWSAGYALCWISKWLIGTLILGSAVIPDVLNTAKFRLSGNDAYPVDHAQTLMLNINTYYFSKGHKPFLLVAAFIVMCGIRLIRNRKNGWGRIFTGTLLIGLFPYIWFFIFSNHSQLHYFYTYRIQAISLFSVFAAISNASGTNDRYP